MFKATRYSARDLKNVSIMLETLAEDLGSRRECCWYYVVSAFENIPKNLVVQGRVQLQGRIQALFKIGNCLWACENRRPNFARSTKDIILILFNSSQIDLNNETQI